MELTEILLIILCSIAGAGLISVTVAFFCFKKFWKKRKKLRDEKMAKKLYERLINEEDEQLRDEIESAINEFAAKNNSDEKSNNYLHTNHYENSNQNKRKANSKNNSDELYAKCVNFVHKMANSANSFGEIFDKKNEAKINDFSEKVFDFLAKNKENINKIQEFKDVLKKFGKEI